MSATSGDLLSARQVIKEGLLTIGCMPVEQTNFPPDYRSVREMLRAKIAACHAVVHLAGELYGAEPKERDAGEPRRSYTQMEYDLARELKKPLYTFVCGDDFPYDRHDPEPEEKHALQQAHRTALLAGEKLRYRVKNPSDLSVKVHSLQTAVEQLAAELKRSRRNLAWGVAVGLTAIVALGAGLAWTRYQTRQEMAELRERAQKSDALVLAVLAHREAPRTAADGADPVLTAQRAAASEFNLSLEQVRQRLTADSADKRQVIADIQQKRAAAEVAAQELRSLERDAQRQLGDAESAAGRYREAVQAYEQALQLASERNDRMAWGELQSLRAAAYNAWGEESHGAAVAERREKGLLAARAALRVLTRIDTPKPWADAQTTLGDLLKARALETNDEAERRRLLSESIACYHESLKVRRRETSPFDWAATQNNMGGALYELADGADMLRLLGEAATAFEAAGTVYTRASYPHWWAVLQLSTGNVLGERARAGEAPDSLEVFARAVAAYRRADEVLTRREYPKEWATGRWGLGRALDSWARVAAAPVRARLFEEARGALREARSYYDSTQDIAISVNLQNALALTFQHEARLIEDGQRRPLLDQAIAVYRVVLTPELRGAYPYEWAYTTANLGEALQAEAENLAGAERTEALTGALKCLRDSLAVITEKDYASDYRDITEHIASAEAEVRNTQAR